MNHSNSQVKAILNKKSHKHQTLNHNCLRYKSDSLDKIKQTKSSNQDKIINKIKIQSHNLK